MTKRDGLVEDLAAQIYEAKHALCGHMWSFLPEDGLTRHQYRAIAAKLVDAGWAREGYAPVVSIGDRA